MKARPIYTKDIPVLQKAIDDDKFHPGEWKVEDFRGFSEVFTNNDDVPIVFTHYTPEEGMSLRIETMWVSPDAPENARAIIFLVRSAAKRAQDSGFENLCFSTSHEKLANFCSKVFGFVHVGGGEYVLSLGK
jgi:hypothetical protein